MRKFHRIWAGALVAIAAMALAPAAGALAAAHPTAHVATHPGVLRPHGKPAGCGTANFCSYKKGNGGSICYDNSNNQPSWSTNCRTVDSVFNNGAAAAVRLYFDTNYGGAWYCLGNGDYLLYMTKNTFDDGGSTKDGHGQPMGNHVKSSELGIACAS
jgi:hypothetical protein